MRDSTNADCWRARASRTDRREAVWRASERGDNGSFASAAAEVAGPGPSMADSATFAGVAAQLGCGNWAGDRVDALAQPAVGLAAPHVRCGSAGRPMQTRVQAGVPLAARCDCESVMREIGSW